MTVPLGCEIDWSATAAWVQAVGSVAAIAAAIDKLAMQPRPPGCKKLKGSADSLWRVRVGDYRVIYKVDDPILIVEVRKIGHRREIYE